MASTIPDDVLKAADALNFASPQNFAVLREFFVDRLREYDKALRMAPEADFKRQQGRSQEVDELFTVLFDDPAATLRKRTPTGQ